MLPGNNLHARSVMPISHLYELRAGSMFVHIFGARTTPYGANRKVVRMSDPCDLPCYGCKMAAEANWSYPLWHDECVAAIKRKLDQAHQEDQEREIRRQDMEQLRWTNIPEGCVRMHGNHGVFTIPALQTHEIGHPFDFFGLMHNEDQEQSDMDEDEEQNDEEPPGVLVISDIRKEDIETKFAHRVMQKYTQWKERLSGTDYEAFGAFLPIVSTRSSIVNDKKLFNQFITELADYFGKDKQKTKEDLVDFNSTFVVVLAHVQHNDQIPNTILRYCNLKFKKVKEGIRTHTRFMLDTH